MICFVNVEMFYYFILKRSFLGDQVTNRKPREHLAAYETQSFEVATSNTAYPLSRNITKVLYSHKMCYIFTSSCLTL